MRTLVLVSSFLLIAAAIGATAGVAQQGPPEHAKPADPNPQQGPGQGGNQSGNGTAQDNQTGGGPPEHANANQAARDRAETDAKGQGGASKAAWKSALSDVRADPSWEQRAQALQRAPEHARGNMGLFEPTPDGFNGRFVSFEAAEDWLAIQNVSVAGNVVFETISFPSGDNVSIRHSGNALHIQGESWRFSIVDAPPAPITMRTSDLPFYLVLPEGTNWQSTHFGALVDYTPQDTDAFQARLVGPDPRDDDVDGLLNVSDSLNFHVSADRVVLSHVANKERGAIDEALTNRAVGGEVTLLRDPEGHGNVLSDVVAYEDMDIQFSPNRGFGDVPANATAHTITVSAHGIPGKTLVVNLEREIVDPSNLHIRYYNQVTEELVEQVPIRMAESLAHALDPVSSGMLPKYWVVEDIDGVQLLVTIPHFSTHHIELLSFDINPVTVSLIAGALGAVVIVALAAAGLFRRPDDEL